jgi:chromosome segregation ATPase
LLLEIEMRMAAEQKAQALENKFKSELEMDWTRFKADIEEAEAAVKAREEAISQTGEEDQIQQLYAQLEAERRARNEIERRLAESESRADNEKSESIFEAERRLAETESALKAANASRAEAERKLAEFVSGTAELQAYFSAGGADPDAALAAWKRSSPLGGNRGMTRKEKINLAGYVVAAVLLAETLIFLLVMGLKAL